MKDKALEKGLDTADYYQEYLKCRKQLAEKEHQARAELIKELREDVLQSVFIKYLTTEQQTELYGIFNKRLLKGEGGNELSKRPTMKEVKDKIHKGYQDLVESNIKLQRQLAEKEKQVRAEQMSDIKKKLKKMCYCECREGTMFSKTKEGKEYCAFCWAWQRLSKGEGD